MLETTSFDGSTPPKRFRDIHPNCWDPATRLADMAATSVTMQALSTVPVMFASWAKPADAYDLHRLLNDHLAEVCQARSANTTSPRPFVGLGVITLTDPELACRELERCVRALGMSGVQIGTHAAGLNLGDPKLRPVFRLAAELGAAVFVHPWDMLGADRMERYWSRWLVGMPTETALAIASVLFSGMLDELPTLRMCFAHGAGAYPSIAGRVQHGFEARPDLCAIDNSKPPKDYLAAPGRPARFYADSLTHDPVLLRSLVDLLGIERVAMGSDYPFPLGEQNPGAMIDAMPEWTNTQRDQLLWGTAAEFLGLNA